MICFLHFSLSKTKQKIISRKGGIFANPCLYYQDIRSKEKSSRDRFTTKASFVLWTQSCFGNIVVPITWDVSSGLCWLQVTDASKAAEKASSVGGSTRIIHRPSMISKGTRKGHTNLEQPHVDASTSHTGENNSENVSPEKFSGGFSGIVQVS